MTENPGEAARLYARKLLYWFAFENDVVSDRLVPGGSGAGPPWLRSLAMLLGYGVLFGLLVVRLALVRRIPFSALDVLLLALYLGAWGWRTRSTSPASAFAFPSTGCW